MARTKKKKRTRKIIAEAAVKLKSICPHILLTHCNRCSLNAMLSATDRHTAKQTNHYTIAASQQDNRNLARLQHRKG